jgi:hypothetical protein
MQEHAAPDVGHDQYLIADLRHRLFVDHLDQRGHRRFSESRIDWTPSTECWHMTISSAADGNCYRPVQLLPPSTGRHTPVMYLASSDGRNSAAWATSHAVPI